MDKKSGVSNATFKKPTKTNASLMEPNAKDNPDSLTPNNPYIQALGGSGKPKGPFGKAGHQF